MTSRTAELAAFAAGLRFEAIPAHVVRKTEDLLVDWFGSARRRQGRAPGRDHRRFRARDGPCLAAAGGAELLVRRSFTSPYFAAMANAAASHVAEQDDVHNGSVFHPATVVLPGRAGAGAGARRQRAGSCWRRPWPATRSASASGEFLGRSHYKVFHTTGTAGTLAAAAAAGHLLGLDAAQMQHAFGSAGTQSAGLWEFLRTAADSKQLHTAHAAAAGLMAAYLAQDGFTGAADILEGPQGMAAGMSTDADPSRLDDRPGRALGHGGDLVQVPRLLPPHASGGRRAAAGDADARAEGRATSSASSPTCTRAPSTCWARSRSRPRCTRASSRWAPCWRWWRASGMRACSEFDEHYPRRAHARRCATGWRWSWTPKSMRAYPQRWIGKVTVHTHRRPRAARARRRAQGRPGQHAQPRGDHRQGAAAGGVQRRRQRPRNDAPRSTRLWQVARWPRVGPLLARA